MEVSVSQQPDVFESDGRLDKLAGKHEV